MIIQDPESYLRSWSASLQARADQVRQLIGNRHWLSDGGHKESLVKSFLQEFIRDEFVVERGFITPATNSNAASREIDIIVAHFREQIPWLKTESLLIVPPECAVAQLQVKTNFGQKELIDIFSSIATGYEAFTYGATASKLWSCAVFFQEGEPAPLTDIAALLWRCMKAAIGQGAPIRTQSELPNLVVILPDVVIHFIKPPTSDQNIERASIKIVRTAGLAASLLLLELSKHISAAPNKKSELEKAVDKIMPKELQMFTNIN